jgi:carbonic anhydrase
VNSEIDLVVAYHAEHGTRLAAPGLPAPPVRHLAVLSCMDARVLLGEMLGLGLGDAHVLRNAGGIVTEDVIRSLLISQVTHRTREVMVVQHTLCGLEGLDEAAVVAQVEQHRGRRPTFPLEAFHDVTASVAASIRRLREEPLLEGVVRGFVYRVETGELVEVEV